ncbi:MAG TPA: ATP/GTP-binding protein [Actinomycetota bacterium]|nr:ATP/GTP-binding protein [Actinomycetota bacterium]
MSARAGIVKRQRATTGNGVISRPLKIVITGPFAAGKTTLIKTISEVAIVGTDRVVTDDTKNVKEHTTVAMDFGRITFAQDLTLFLFGTPGQRRFEVMWEILSEGMIGFICLVNAADDRSIEESAHILGTFREYADVPYVVGVSHLDEVDEDRDAVFEKVRATLDVPETVEIVACDPRDREDVKTLMLQILYGVMQRLEVSRSRAKA